MKHLKCPKCKGSLEKIIYSSIEVHRCIDCKGIWFESQGAERLKKIKGSESIDIGDTITGSKFNQIGNVNCPKCSTQMTKMVDLKQPHIWYEKCPVCCGTWFDAGEFKDYKQQGILEMFKDIFAKERR